MIRTDLLEPWKNAIKTKGFYPLRDCSICGSTLGWLPNQGHIFFEGSCDCASISGLRYASDQDLEFYLEDTHGHIQKIETFIKEVTNEV